MGRVSWRRPVAGILALLLTAACAFTPHDTDIQPTVQPSDSTIGAGTPVFFRFVDERDDVVVGHRGVGTMGAKVSATNLPTIVEAQLRDALQRKAFVLVASEQANTPTVVYRLRSFKFDIESGFFTAGRNASVALAVDAKRGDRTYNNVYRYNSEERIVFIPGGTEINGQMNAALSQVLQKAIDDQGLDRFLVTR
ncbi:MAG TPA: YajG family lipoprotein [Vineibacter sp.]|nr:YajG family lipoprotein [Vineibacter sp.]